MNLILVYQHYMGCPVHDVLGEPYLKFFYTDFLSLLKFVQFNMKDFKAVKIYLDGKESDDIELLTWHEGHEVSHLTLTYYGKFYTIRMDTIVDGIVKEITALQ